MAFVEPRLCLQPENMNFSGVCITYAQKVERFHGRVQNNQAAVRRHKTGYLVARCVQNRGNVVQGTTIRYRRPPYADTNNLLIDAHKKCERIRVLVVKPPSIKDWDYGYYVVVDYDTGHWVMRRCRDQADQADQAQADQAQADQAQADQAQADQADPGIMTRGTKRKLTPLMTYFNEDEDDVVDAEGEAVEREAWVRSLTYPGTQ